MLHDSQVDLNRLLHDDAGFGGAFGQHLLDHGHTDEPCHDLLGPRSRGKDIDVAHSLLSPAIAACSGDVLKTCYPSKIGQNLIDNGFSCAVENTLASLFVSLNGPLDVLLSSLSHPGKSADAVFRCSLFEVIQVGNIQLFMQHENCLGSQPRDLKKLGLA